jgi:hypothetical protein
VKPSIMLITKKFPHITSQFQISGCIVTLASALHFSDDMDVYANVPFRSILFV